jgi:protein-tyrosine phosphatase
MPHGVAGQGWLHIMQGDAAWSCPGALGPVRSVGCMGRTYRPLGRGAVLGISSPPPDRTPRRRLGTVMPDALRAPRFLDLDGLVNARDLGGWATEPAGRTRFGHVFRSELPPGDAAGARDALAEAGVRTILDLRTPPERRAAPGPFATDERFEVVSVDLIGPVDAARHEGRLPAHDGDLARVYLDVLELARDRLLQALAVVRRAVPRGAILIHCTAGKDRTGLVAALLLRGAGVDARHVADEYALTHDRLAPLRPALMEGAEAMGVPARTYARLLDARPAFLRPFLASIDDALLLAARGILPTERA